MEASLFPFLRGDIIRLKESGVSLSFLRWEAGNRVVGFYAWKRDEHDERSWQLGVVSISVDVLIREGFKVLGQRKED